MPRFELPTVSQSNDYDNHLLFEAWRIARPRLLERIQEFKHLLTEPSGSRDDLRRRAHRLSGTLGCFGLHECGFIARVVENQLLQQAPRSDLVEKIDTLYQQVQKADPTPTRAGSPVPPVALFAGADFPLSDLLAFGYSHGVKIVPMDDLGGLLGKEWSLIILDTSHPGFATFPKGLEIPVLGIIQTDTLANRLESVLSGAQLVYPKNEDIKQLYSALARIFSTSSSGLRRILMVDDDPVFSMVTQRILTSAGYQVAAEKDAESFWTRLETFSPELVLLGLNLPGVNGEDLCRVIRADHHWSDLPVIFLATNAEQMVAERLHEVGADDCLGRPLPEELLLKCIANHGRRRQAHRNELLDGITKLPTRKVATQNLERMMSLCRRQKTPLSLAILDLDHFKSVNDTHGHMLGDRVLAALGQLLKNTFRSEDVLCRWGGEEFAVGQLGCNGPQALERLTQMLLEFQQLSFTSEAGSFQVSFSAGISVFPEDGNDIGTLYRQADAALYKAKEAGRSRVFLANSQNAETLGERRIDVLLIEDDLELSQLVISACNSRGFVVGHYADGLRALDDWQEGKVARPRILLLDNELPGLNGIQLLRRLIEERRLDNTRVFMLSGLLEFSEILESGSLGEFEFIPKPFDLKLLMAKLEGILHSPPELSKLGQEPN